MKCWVHNVSCYIETFSENCKYSTTFGKVFASYVNKKTTSVVTDESLVIQKAKSSVPLTELLTNLFIFLVTLFSSTPCV